jgi:hypothetical protein
MLGGARILLMLEETSFHDRNEHHLISIDPDDDCVQVPALESRRNSRRWHFYQPPTTTKPHSNYYNDASDGD